MLGCYCAICQWHCIILGDCLFLRRPLRLSPGTLDMDTVSVAWYTAWQCVCIFFFNPAPTRKMSRKKSKKTLFSWNHRNAWCVMLRHLFTGCIAIITKSTGNYSKTSLNRPAKEPTLSGSFREVVGLGMFILAIVWARNKAIDIEEWSICGCGRLERFYCIFILGNDRNSKPSD